MLQVGFAKVDITPALGTRLGGYGVPERPAEVIHDPLAATAVVFKQHGVIAAHVTVDVGVIMLEDMQRARELASQASGIPASQINIGASHTHSAPQTFTFHGWGTKDEAYVDEMVQKIAQAVAQAHEACQPAKMGIATRKTLVGISRRTVSIGNQITFDGDENAPYDSTMTVIRFEGEQGPIGVIVHATAHCTAMGINRLVSRDWAGVMIDRMESQIKAPVLFINGSFGDTGPRTNFISPHGFSGGTGDGIHAVNEVGYLAAGDALRAHQSIRRYEADPQLAVLVQNIDIPLAPLPPLEEAQAKLIECEPTANNWGQGMCNYNYWQRVIESHRQGINDKTRPYAQTLIAFGPVAIVPMPGEPFTTISLRLRRQSPYAHTLVSGCTNGNLAYLPDREGRARGGYEPWVCIGVLTQVLADDSDDALVDRNLELLETLQKQTPTAQS